MVTRLDRSVEAMKTEYPDFGLAYEVGEFGNIAVWRGVVQPTKQLVSLSSTLEDIEAERPVRVVNGEILHHAECDVDHSVHPLAKRLIYWKTKFELRVQYDGGRSDPRCWVITPPIPPDQRRHIWPDGTICPFMSGDAWDADRDDVVDFMGHAAIWLLKWTAFSQTGVWLGREHQGTPDYHLRVLKPDDNCWCRSGRRYGGCHRPSDQQLVRNATPIPISKNPRPAPFCWP